MTDQVINPYAAPAASVEPVATSESSFGPFPRFSAWWVFLLIVVTFGIYGYYWMFTRTNVLNKHYPEHGISLGVVWTALGVLLAQLLIGFWVGFSSTTDSAAVGAIVWLDPLLSILGTVMWLVWLFTIRNRINRISGALYGESTWAGGILTFFFSVVYLAFKINQLKDAE